MQSEGIQERNELAVLTAQACAADTSIKRPRRISALYSSIQSIIKNGTPASESFAAASAAPGSSFFAATSRTDARYLFATLQSVSSPDG